MSVDLEKSKRRNESSSPFDVSTFVALRCSGGQGLTLSRLGAGIGTRGPGEMKLETDRRAIGRRIHTLEQRIARIRRQRETRRNRRQKNPIPTIALVGYTNAGKSTLLNALTGADAFVEDKLFATLDTTTIGRNTNSRFPVRSSFCGSRNLRTVPTANR